MKNEKTLLALLAAIQFTNILDFVIMMPLGPQLMRTLEIGPQQFGLVVSAYTFSAGFSGLAAAFFIDRYNRKTALLVLYLGFALGTLACVAAPTHHWLIAARALTGMFGGVLGSLVLAIIGDAVPEERRGRAIGVVMGAFSVASVLGVPFGLYLATRYSWHAPFILLGVLSLAIWVLIYFALPNMRGHIDRATSLRERAGAVVDLFGNPSVRAALLLITLLMLGQFTVVSFLSPYLVGNVGFSENQLSYIYLVGGVVTIFSSPLAGRLADRYGKVRVFTAGSLASVPMLLLITHLGPLPLGLALTATAGLFIVMSSRFIPATALATSVVEPRRRGSFMSLNTSVQQFAAGLASFLAGFIVVKTTSGALLHYDWVGYLAVAANLLSMWVVRQVRPAEVVSAPAEAAIVVH